MNRYEEELEKEIEGIEFQDDKVKAQGMREFQRQEFIEDLFWLSYREEDEIGERNFHLRLVPIIIDYLIQRRNKVSEPKLLIDSVGIFFGSAMAKIKAFSRTEVEKDALIVKFLNKVFATGVHPFESDLLSQEIRQPEKILGISPNPAQSPP